MTMPIPKLMPHDARLPARPPGLPSLVDVLAGALDDQDDDAQAQPEPALPAGAGAAPDVATAAGESATPGGRGERRRAATGEKARPNTAPENSGEKTSRGDSGGTAGSGGRYFGLPVVVIRFPDGMTAPAPYLMNDDDAAAFFRLHDGRGTRFPKATLRRYRDLGLKSVRVGRRRFYRLDDVLRFLDQQQDRLQHR